MAPQPNLSEVLVLREQFQSCDQVVSLREDEYRILKDGSIFVYKNVQILGKEEYCLYPQFNSEFPQSIWVVHHICNKVLLPATIEITIISVICYILTLSVYLYVKKLRNVLGKVLICSLFCTLFNNLTLVLDEFNILNRICLISGYFRYFSMLAYNLWMCVISFHLWKSLTSMSREEPRFQFCEYSAFAWGMAAFPTGVIYLINEVWEKDLHKWNWMPLVGYYNCELRDIGPSSFIYLIGPMLILTILIVIMFVLTVIGIYKVKRELKKLNQDEEMTIQCFSFDTET
nr:probable G-protein coupled receptor Mth-like 12 [Drosophila takahashii]